MRSKTTLRLLTTTVIAFSIASSGSPSFASTCTEPNGAGQCIGSVLAFGAWVGAGIVALAEDAVLVRRIFATERPVRVPAILSLAFSTAHVLAASVLYGMVFANGSTRVQDAWLLLGVDAAATAASIALATYALTLDRSAPIRLVATPVRTARGVEPGVALAVRW